MSQRVVYAVVLAIILFGVYSWFTTRNGVLDPFVSAAIDVDRQMYEPATASNNKAKIVEVDSSGREVAPGGPASPAQAPPRSLPAFIAPDEQPYDPQEKGYESAQIPERLRHPERSFGPAVVADNTDHAIQSGIASQATQVTTQAYQQFGPEMAQNGGSFLDNGVMANDVDVQSSYSSV